MRRIATASLLVLLAACGGGDPQPATTTGESQVVPAVAPDAPSTSDPNRWVDEHFAPGWFADRVVEEPVIADADMPEDSTGFMSDAPFEAPPAESSPPTSPGGAPVPVPEVPPDSREAQDPGPPRRSERGLGARAGEERYEDEANPRFGAASDDPEPDPEPEPQAEPWQRSSQTTNASRLMVGDEDSLPLQAFQAAVRIDGHRARIVLDYCYENTFDFAAEGIFKLRLPDEAAVHYLAFGDVAASAPLLVPVPSRAPLELTHAALTAARGGATIHREARIVPREEAQQAYAAETAQAVDPALLEWNGAGVFTTRVFPLPADKVSRVTVAYDVDLVEQGGSMHLDLGIPGSAKRTLVAIDEGTGPQGRRVVEDSTESLLRISVPAPRITAITGDDPAIGPHFATSIAPEIPVVEAAARSRAVFLVDASMSSNPDRMNVWVELLRATLEQNREELTEFAVLFFNVETWWWRGRLSPNEPETVDALLDDLARVGLEGATDLGAALREAAAPAWTTTDLGADLFLLSDGAETWGATAAQDVAAELGTPVFCYTTGLAGTDTRGLQALARSTGGAVFAVTGARDVVTAAVAHRSRPWALRSVRLAGCHDVLVAGRPSAVYPGQRLPIAGRGRPAEGDSVVLTLEQGGQSRDVAVPLERVVPSELAARAYGEIATGQLESLGDVAATESRAYALHYGVTGETCSLLMLETEDDYLEYGIVRTQDELTVRERPVSAVVSALDAEAARARSDARAAFLVWLDRLERLAADSGGFRDLDELRAAARELPVSAFEVRAPPLRAKTRTWDDVGEGFARMMRAADPGYGAVLLEAEGRHSVRGTADAIRALSSLVEADAGSVDVQRDVAFTLLGWDAPGAAYGLLRRVADARPFEPETYRALAECLERTGNVDYAMLVHEIALRGNWDARFGAFSLVAAMDYRGLLRRIEHGKAETRLGGLADAARKRIAADYVDGDPDLVVTMTWNTDRTDVDLHVTDPAGEVCKYDHPRTELGGAITQDVTGGYGPEMFVLGRAVPGEYVILAHYYGSDALRKTLRSRVFLTITRRFGRADEQTERRAFLLEETNDVVEVLRFAWE